MAWLSLITKFINPAFIESLMNWCKNLFLGFFVVKVGKDKQELNQIKKEQKNVAETKEITDHVESMSDDELRSMLVSTED
jgi:hypothetical protein